MCAVSRCASNNNPENHPMTTTTALIAPSLLLVYLSMTKTTLIFWTLMPRLLAVMNQCPAHNPPNCLDKISLLQTTKLKPISTQISSQNLPPFLNPQQRFFTHHHTTHIYLTLRCLHSGPPMKPLRKYPLKRKCPALTPHGRNHHLSSFKNGQPLQQNPPRAPTTPRKRMDPQAASHHQPSLRSIQFLLIDMLF